MQREYDALIENGTWRLVDRPTDQHVLTAKWAFKRKRDIDGNIKRYKARWVARGFEQREGVDYFETFAAVVKPQTNKVLFAMTAKKNLHSHQVDMITAFLNSREYTSNNHHTLTMGIKTSFSCYFRGFTD